MNLVQLTGRVARKFDLQEFGKKDNKVQVLSFVVAVSKNKDEADFIPVKAFGKTAETIDEYVEAGDQIILQAHIQTGSYDNDDGDTIYTQDIIVDRMEFGAKKQKEKGGKKGR